MSFLSTCADVDDLTAFSAADAVIDEEDEEEEDEDIRPNRPPPSPKMDYETHDDDVPEGERRDVSYEIVAHPDQEEDASTYSAGDVIKVRTFVWSRGAPFRILGGSFTSKVTLADCISDPLLQTPSANSILEKYRVDVYHQTPREVHEAIVKSKEADLTSSQIGTDSFTFNLKHTFIF